MVDGVDTFSPSPLPSFNKECVCVCAHALLWMLHVCFDVKGDAHVST